MASNHNATTAAVGISKEIHSNSVNHTNDFSKASEDISKRDQAIDSLNSSLPEHLEQDHYNIKVDKGIRSKNICFFVANICLVNMFYMILTAYTNGVVRTLERRFGLSSYQTGFLNSCNDIVHILVVIFVGYFSQKRNKPRIMCVTAMFSAMSGIINATPHFLFPDHPPDRQNLLETNYYTQSSFVVMDLKLRDNGFGNFQNSTIPNELFPSTKIPFQIITDQNLSIWENFQYCHQSTFFDSDNMTDSFHNKCPSQGSKVHPAYYVFLVSQLINGIGSSAIFTLSMAYIDENSPKNRVSIYIGAYTSLYSIGPVLGLLLSSFCLKLPENLLSGSTAKTTDPSFIGCWWLGYLFGGVGLAFFAFFLWFYPSNPRKSIEKLHINALDIDANLIKAESSEKDLNFIEQLRGIPKAFISLLSNKLYIVNLCLLVSGAYSIYGVFVNLVRYLEVHFNRTAVEASTIASATLAVTGIFGGVSGGTLISKLRLETKGGLKLVLLLSVVFAIGLVILINLGCPQVKMAMTMDKELKKNVVNNYCNSDCGCNTTRTDYYPICGTDNISYFSPCIAGCSGKVNDTSINCKCFNNMENQYSLNNINGTNINSHNGTAKPGYCVQDCGLLIPFVITLFIMSFASTIGKVPSTMISFRIVKDEERSFALGVNSFVLNLCGFIPGPLVFGSLIDSTCLLWQRSCNTTGACLLFDTDKLRKYTYGASLVVEAVTFTCNLCLFLLIRKIPLGSTRLSRQKEIVMDTSL